MSRPRIGPPWKVGHRFEIITTDSNGASAIGTAEIVVAPVNDEPVIDDASVETDEDEQVVIPMTFADVEDDLVMVLRTEPTSGTVEIDGANLVYTPDPDVNGDDSFTVSVTDSGDASAEATVTVAITAVNDAPTIEDAEATVDEDSSVIIPIEAADIDSKFGLSIETEPAKGTVEIDGFDVTYTPNADANGADSFEVKVSDTDGASAVSTVDVSISPINDDPTAVACDGVTVEAGESITIDLTACGDDIDGDSLEVVAGSAAAASGSVEANGTEMVDFTSGIVGDDTVTAALTDGAGGTVDVAIVVAVEPETNIYIGATGIEGELVRIYSAMLGRQPDAAGFAYWTQLRATGLSLDAMIQLFAESPEFESTFGDRIATDTNAQWVDFIYVEIMGRTPEPGGRAYWIGELEAGRLSRSEMVMLFAESPEYRAITQTN